MILFQGLEDQVVPPNQAEADGRRRCARRGCRSPTSPSRASSTASAAPRTIQRALEAELYFYGRIFGFEPADPIVAVDIENLP